MGYFRYFRRLAAGTLTLAGYLQTDGVNIVTANNSWPCVCDYNADGKKDLLVGQEGIGSPCNVYVYLNIGTNAAPVFTDSTPVLLGGIPTPYYRTIPVLLDLDLDGRKDMILGGWYSDVRFYSNTGTNANPVFTTYTYLVNPDSSSYSNGNPPRLNFTDWDGDGDLDMITCDYYGSVFLRRNVTTTGVTENDEPAQGNTIFSVTPNPTAGPCHFQIRLSSPCFIRTDVYSAAGLHVASPFAIDALAGDHRFDWDPRGLPDGVYFIRIILGEDTQIRKITLTR